ncbi:MAG TPA: hypothetical protein VGE65_04260 [Sphingobium sp.]
MFSFSYDPERVLLTVVQKGYWSMAVFRDFERDFLVQHDKIRIAHKNYRVFADCREYPVQSIEIGEAFSKLFMKLMDENKGHYAIVVASTLNKIQAKRAIPQPNVQAFSDPEEAMEWLFLPGSLPD